MSDSDDEETTDKIENVKLLSRVKKLGLPNETLSLSEVSLKEKIKDLEEKVIKLENDIINLGVF